MITQSGITHTLVERKLGDLVIDPNVQRTLKKSRVNTMAAAFDPLALGVLTTSWRTAKNIHIIDGMHRYRTCETVGYTGIIQTMEYRGLTIPQEAALFRKLNATEKVNRIDQFLVACVEQDPKALALALVLAEHGWEVSSSTAEGRITAIASLERVYDLDPDAARATVNVITEAFGHRPAGVQGSMVEGLGRFIAKYGVRQIDLADLATRLARVPSGADGLLGNARGMKLTHSGNLSTQVAKIILGLYNQRRRTTALPSWE